LFDGLILVGAVETETTEGMIFSSLGALDRGFPKVRVRVPLS
jgi:hypothetical protein